MLLQLHRILSVSCVATQLSFSGGVASLLARMVFAVEGLVHCCVFLLSRELPVRVEAVMALRSFVEELDDVTPLKPVLAQLMDSIFKLMNEV